MTVLFMVGTIIFFLCLDWLVRRMRHEQPATAAPQRVVVRPLRIPEGIFFTKSHTWLNLYPTGKLLLGIDDFIGSLVENPQITHLKKVGDAIQKGEPLVQLTSGTRTLTIRSPLDGEIIETNEQLSAHPELLHENLFNDGWSYLIKTSKPAQVKDFLLGTETKAWIRDEFRRLRDFFAGMSAQGTLEPAYLQDGGLPAAGILEKMDGSQWSQFEQQFLSNHN